MGSKIWLVNLLLAGVAAFCGVQAYESWTRPPRPIAAARQSEPLAPDQGKRLVKPNMPAESAYRAMVEKNLFSPDREEYIPPEPTEEAEEPEAEVKQVKVSGRKIVLYGVILMKGYRAALINNPERGGEREQIWVKPGEAIGEDLTVDAIREKSLLVAEKDKKYEILLYDDKKPKSRSTPQEESGPTVVSTEAKKPAKPSKPKDKSKPKQESVSDEEYEIIKTPFGTIRKKKS